MSTDTAAARDAIDPRPEDWVLEDTRRMFEHKRTCRRLACKIPYVICRDFAADRARRAPPVSAADQREQRANDRMGAFLTYAFASTCLALIIAIDDAMQPWAQLIPLALGTYGYFTAVRRANMHDREARP